MKAAYIRVLYPLFKFSRIPYSLYPKSSDVEVVHARCRKKCVGMNLSQHNDTKVTQICGLEIEDLSCHGDWG